MMFACREFVRTEQISQTVNIAQTAHFPMMLSCAGPSGSHHLYCFLSQLPLIPLVVRVDATTDIAVFRADTGVRLHGKLACRATNDKALRDE